MTTVNRSSSYQIVELDAYHTSQEIGLFLEKVMTYHSQAYDYEIGERQRQIRRGAAEHLALGMRSDKLSIRSVVRLSVELFDLLFLYPEYEVAVLLDELRSVQINRTKKRPPRIKPFNPIIYPQSKGVDKCDPPHDWLDDPLVAIGRPLGPYTFDNADEYLDTEPVELYNGWLVRQEMSDYQGKVFEGDLHEHVGGAARLLGFGRVLPDQMECLLSNGYTIKPDLSMVSWEREKQRVKPYGPNDRSTLMGSPEFVVEVRSPSNRRAQEKDKRKRYFDNGAEIIWDIDEKAQIIYVYRANSQNSAEVYTIDDEINCEPLLPGWRRQVSDLFAQQASVEVVLSEVVETYREKGKEIGLEEGLEEGKEIGREEGEKIGEQRSKQGMLILILQTRFTDVSEQILNIITQTQDIDELDNWLNQALVAQSVDELSFADKT